jgi:hypothetical protein
VAFKKPLLPEATLARMPAFLAVATASASGSVAHGAVKEP